MASYAYTFVSGDTVTPTKLNNARTISNIVNADVSATAAIAGTKIAPNFGSQNVVTTGSAGIGTASPSAPLEVFISTGNTEYFRAGSSVSDRSLRFSSFAVSGTNSVGHDIKAPEANGTLTFSTASSERVRITAIGRVGIGATAPATTLEVRNPTGNTEYLRVGGGSLTDRSLRFSSFLSNTVNNAGHDINAPEANGAITLSTASTERLRIKAQGQVRFQPLASDPSGAEAGDVYYNSTSNKLRVRTNTAWVDLH
jgi:uncharacterized protein YaiE (UPF0345 family)